MDHRQGRIPQGRSLPDARSGEQAVAPAADRLIHRADVEDQDRFDQRAHFPPAPAQRRCLSDGLKTSRWTSGQSRIAKSGPGLGAWH